MLVLLKLDAANVDEGGHVFYIMLLGRVEHLESVLDSVLMLVDEAHIDHGV